MRHREREWRLENRLAERKYCFGKDSPSPPPAPDYVGAAQAQGTANLKSGQQTAVLSNPNVNSPYGSQTVNYQPLGGENPDTAGLLSPTVTQTLSPASQQILDAQNQTKLGLAGLGQQGLSTAQSVLGQPYQYSGPGIQTSVPGVQNTALQTSFANPGVQTSFNNPGVQGQLDTSNVAKMPINAGTTGFQAMMARLDPQLTQQRNTTETALRNQGLVPGGEAYDFAERNLNQSQNDARLQAAAQAIGLDLAANQQGFGQALQGGQFANQAAGQQYGQNLGSAQFANQAAGQQYGQNLGAAQFANQTAGQQFGQNLAQGQYGLQSAQFGNTAAQQALAQQLQLRNQPLNEITALMSGSQINNPQFQGYNGANIAAPNYQGIAQQQGLYGQGLYNAQVGAQNAQTSGLYGLGSSALGAYGMYLAMA